MKKLLEIIKKEIVDFFKFYLKNWQDVLMFIVIVSLLITYTYKATENNTRIKACSEFVEEGLLVTFNTNGIITQECMMRQEYENYLNMQNNKINNYTIDLNELK